jgi:hypothetical protein
MPFNIFFLKNKNKKTRRKGIVCKKICANNISLNLAPLSKVSFYFVVLTGE